MLLRTVVIFMSFSLFWGSVIMSIKSVVRGDYFASLVSAVALLFFLWVLAVSLGVVSPNARHHRRQTRNAILCNNGAQRNAQKGVESLASLCMPLLGIFRFYSSQTRPVKRVYDGQNTE